MKSEKYQQVIKYFETTSTKQQAEDMEIHEVDYLDFFKPLQEEFNFNDSIMNVLISFVYNCKILEHSKIRKIAIRWSDADFKTVEQAMEYARKQRETYLNWINNR
jgi:replication initiation and membrane attachment protein DnaB